MVYRSMPHLIVVDDDPRIRSMLSHYLEGEGFRVSLADSASQLRRVLSPSIDLVLLDIGLPDCSGLDLAREIGANFQIPTIIVSGRDDDIDRIIGLEMGADDYVSKPFNLRELLARVRSVLRRSQRAMPLGTAQTATVSIFQFDGWTLDADRRQLTSASGRGVELTTGEFDLLMVFVTHAGRVLTRDFLLDETRGRLREAFDRAIDVQVTRLRRKVEDDPGDPRRIMSVRGVGYVFATKVHRPM
ncbi:response regulator transcription factor [Sinorhizobium sp. 7-81]|uniref:response regulator transcription factor n=1 Tax=Sinorhizobium sp. 8-89 TaxID=3049089 RepID=UPI0024C31CAC|nr:response regulator transcription factor [Sinorhizobium sp. 8-89]MDK1491211.1 response regulator transcription factor [Sinorhizobium sp. 8-89]